MPTREQKQYRSAAYRRKAAGGFNINVDDAVIPMVAVKNLQDLAPLLDGLEAAKAAMPADAPVTAKLQKAGEDRDLMASIVREFVRGDGYEAWDEVQADLDAALLGDIIADLMREYTGADPTSQASSSDGLTPTSTPSTPGAESTAVDSTS